MLMYEEVPNPITFIELNDIRIVEVCADRGRKVMYQKIGATWPYMRSTRITLHAVPCGEKRCSNIYLSDNLCACVHTGNRLTCPSSLNHTLGFSCP